MSRTYDQVVADQKSYSERTRWRRKAVSIVRHKRYRERGNHSGPSISINDPKIIELARNLEWCDLAAKALVSLPQESWTRYWR